MSLIKESKASADNFAMFKYSRCSESRSVSRTNSVIPMIPFMGVRISWLMFAKNSLLARLEGSAASFACCMASSARFRVEMSW